MPRVTQNTENRRKQYNSQDSFRWTTPRVDVSARPVDAFTRAENVNYKAPSKAGTLNPLAPTQRSAPIKATERSGMLEPGRTVTGFVRADDSAFQAILSFTGQAAQFGLQVADSMAQSGAKEDVQKYEDMRAGGMSHDEALKNSRPETIFGLQEMYYDQARGAGARQGISAVLQSVYDDPKNANLSVQEMEDAVGRTYLDAVAGESKDFRSALGTLGASSISQAGILQSKRLQDKMRKEVMSQYQQAIPATHQFIMDEMAGTQADKDAYFRNVVSQQQERYSTFGLTKEEITSSTVDAIGQAMLDDPLKYPGGAEANLGWLKTPDASGIAAISNPKIHDKFLSYEASHESALKNIRIKADQEVALKKKDTYDGFANELLMAVKDKQLINTADFDKRLEAQAEILGFEGLGNLKALQREFTTGKVIDNEDAVFDFEQKYRSGQFELLPTNEEIRAGIRNGVYSKETGLKFEGYLTTASNQTYTSAMADMKAAYKGTSDVTNAASLFSQGDNAEQLKATAFLSSRVAEEMEANDGIMPNPAKMRELVKETHDYMKPIDPNGVRTTADMVAKRSPDTWEKEYERLNPDSTTQDFIDFLKEQDKQVTVAQKAAGQKAMAAQPVQRQQDNVKQLQPSKAQNWANDTVAAQYEMAQQFAHKYLGGKGTEEIMSAIGSVWDKLQADHGRNQDAVHGRQPTINQETSQTMDVTKELPPYVNALAQQENGPLTMLSPDQLIMPNKAPEDGGGMDIGFGHKLTGSEKKSGEVYGIDITKGITKNQAYMILNEDTKVHQAQAAAYVGPEKFDALPPIAQDILTDFSFTGTIDKFPKFVEAVLNGDFATMRDEYERYFKQQGSSVPLRNRNEMMLAMIDEWDANNQ